MQVIKCKEDMLKVCEDYEQAYDVDYHEFIYDYLDCDRYKYPLLLDFKGTTYLGDAFKVYTNEDIAELKSFIEMCEAGG